MATASGAAALPHDFMQATVESLSHVRNEVTRLTTENGNLGQHIRDLQSHNQQIQAETQRLVHENQSLNHTVQELQRQVQWQGSQRYKGFDERKLKLEPYSGDHAKYQDFSWTMGSFIRRESAPLKAAMDSTERLGQAFRDRWDLDVGRRIVGADLVGDEEPVQATHSNQRAGDR